MSLTSHLADTNSEVYKFFRERLPNTRRLVTAYNKQIKDTQNRHCSRIVRRESR